MPERNKQTVPGHREIEGSGGVCECGFVESGRRTMESHHQAMEALVQQGRRESWDTAQSTFRFASAIHEKMMLPKNAKKQHWSTLTTQQQVQLLRNEFTEVSELLDAVGIAGTNRQLAGELEDLGAQAMILWERIKGIS